MLIGCPKEAAAAVHAGVNACSGDQAGVPPGLTQVHSSSQKAIASILMYCLSAFHVAVPAAEHFVDELEMELADGLLEDFQVEAEDGSPAQVRMAVAGFISTAAFMTSACHDHCNSRQLDNCLVITQACRPQQCHVPAKQLGTRVLCAYST